MIKMKRDDILKDNNKLFASWAWKRDHGGDEYYLIDTNGDCWLSYDPIENYIKIGIYIWGCKLGENSNAL